MEGHISEIHWFMVFEGTWKSPLSTSGTERGTTILVFSNIQPRRRFNYFHSGKEAQLFEKVLREIALRLFMNTWRVIFSKRVWICHNALPFCYTRLQLWSVAVGVFLKLNITPWVGAPFQQFLFLIVQLNNWLKRN